VTVAHMDSYRPPPFNEFTPVQLSAMGKLQDCIDAIASCQVDPIAMVIGMARADAEPIILTTDATSLDAFDQIVEAADQVALTVRDHEGPGSPTAEQLMTVIREHWEQRP
jgi:hypothetical protein